MKEGWEYKKLGEIAKICLGLTHTPRYQECGIPFISVKDISNGDLDFKDTKFISKKEFDSMPDGAKPQKGDILFCRVGTIGKPQILKTDIPFGIFVSVGFLRIIDKSLTEFIKYWMESPLFYKQVRDNVQGSTIKNLNTGWLKKFIVPIPPLSEQQSIVDYLDSAFAKIDAMKANAEKALNEAKALFQASLKEMLEPKDGWEEKYLKEIAEYSIGLTYKPTDVCDDGTIVLRSSNIQEGKLDLNDIVRVNTSIKEKLYVQCGDILMCSRNGSARLVGKVCIIPELKERMTYGTFMMVIRSAYNPLLYHYFDTDLFRRQIKHGEANMINQITRYMLDDVKLNLPPIKEQQSIVATLDSLKSKVDRLQENYDKITQECDALKQAILRQVFE